MLRPRYSSILENSRPRIRSPPSTRPARTATIYRGSSAPGTGVYAALDAPSAGRFPHLHASQQVEEDEVRRTRSHPQAGKSPKALRTSEGRFGTCQSLSANPPRWRRRRFNGEWLPGNCSHDMPAPTCRLGRQPALYNEPGSAAESGGVPPRPRTVTRCCAWIRKA